MKTLSKILEASIPYNPQQRFSELKPFLKEVIANNCHSVLEIGAAEGGLTYIFSEIFTKVVALDIKHYAKYEKENITRLTVDSNNPGPEMIKIDWLGPYDLIFIDGNHAYKSVKQDYERYAPLLSIGGIIALHDVKDTEIQRQNHCEVHLFAKQLDAMNLHILTKTFIKFTDEWSGLDYPDMINHGGIQMWKFL